MAEESLEIVRISGPGLLVAGDDIDTDRIVPARFLKSITFEGLGKAAFYDERFNEDGSLKEHPMNHPKAPEAKILVSGRNFGCGSSREHAPQALYRFGLRAVVAESYADIFFNNSTALGLVCVCLESDGLKRLQDLILGFPDTELDLDLSKMTLQFGDEIFNLTMPKSQREALVSGKWDPLFELLSNIDKAKNLEKSLPYSAF